MGKVVVVAKVYPKGTEVDRKKLLLEVTQALKGIAEVKKSEEEPIAFGLVALRLHIIIPEEAEGGTDGLEEKIGSLPDVSNVEVTHVYRI